ncbi:glycosyltransferase family 4 protein [Siccirubricoccus sp. KC 17139]|uniref:Glycosyltransferase family 4 protein n=1 Tax=Siccirubricoccus soli TaxID=2899147 RepID=A0ABT1DCJ9_9PROT|nr:glycosyltransferase family 4 protein [Siccirubricoccus soli]MCO6419671.1 glycosyltransferase family 4 protein [Siccirubricoccus soli]MCP2685806.1 glycosyltransferase family 4 protein [Siccirubricoccus soli]
MRLLYLHQHFSTAEGATGTRSLAMAEALAARGHRVTLACGQYAGAASGLTGPFAAGRREGRVGGLRVVEFAIPCGNAQGFLARTGAFLRFAAAATRLALAEDWDMVIASSTPLTVALPALAARAWRGIPFLFEIRDPWPELPRAMGVGGGPLGWWAMDRLADAACRQAAAVVTLSEGMAETARRHGAAPERVTVLPNGCDTELFGPAATPWRPEGVGRGELLAVYAGAHGAANGLDQLLSAARLLEAQGAPLRLLLVGEGGEKPRLRARAAALGLRRVEFLDPLPKPRLAGLLAGAQIGVQCLAPVPAFAEWTSPNKLMDYLAAGLPVVANLGGRAARLLESDPLGACGVATPPGDVPALAAALAGLAADPVRRAAMGMAARAQAEARWARWRLAERFCDTVEQARGTPEGGSPVTSFRDAYRPQESGLGMGSRWLHLPAPAGAFPEGMRGAAASSRVVAARRQQVESP